MYKKNLIIAGLIALSLHTVLVMMSPNVISEPEVIFKKGESSLKMHLVPSVASTASAKSIDDIRKDVHKVEEKKIDNPDMPLDSLKLLAQNFLPNNAGTMHFLGLKKFKDFSEDVLAVLNQLNSKEEFKELIGALYAYANRMMFWIHEITPHGLGVFYPKQDSKTLEEINKVISPEIYS